MKLKKKSGKRRDPYSAGYFHRLNPANIMRFSPAMLGGAAGLSVGGPIGAGIGLVAADQAAKYGLKRLFHPK